MGTGCTAYHPYHLAGGGEGYFGNGRACKLVAAECECTHESHFQFGMCSRCLRWLSWFGRANWTHESLDANYARRRRPRDGDYMHWPTPTWSVRAHSTVLFPFTFPQTFSQCVQNLRHNIVRECSRKKGYKWWWLERRCLSSVATLNCTALHHALRGHRRALVNTSPLDRCLIHCLLAWRLDRIRTSQSGNPFLFPVMIGTVNINIDCGH